jgi:hypothetical protein
MLNHALISPRKKTNPLALPPFLKLKKEIAAIMDSMNQQFGITNLHGYIISSLFECGLAKMPISTDFLNLLI